MPIEPRILPEEEIKTSNILMLLHVLAKRHKDVFDELERVKTDANIKTARKDVIEGRWGALLSFQFNPVFTLEKYREILLGLLRARFHAPAKKALIETVKAFIPEALVNVLDFWKDSNFFEGPKSETFLKWNDTASSANKWNSTTNVWSSNKLLREFGFTDFGTQVHVHINNPEDVQFLRFIPKELKIVKPDHVIVALVTTQEVIA